MRTAKQLQEEVSAAFAEGDIERMFGCFAEDCVVREAPGLPFGGDWVGHDGMRAMFGVMAQNFELQPHVARRLRAERLDGHPPHDDAHHFEKWRDG